MANQYPYPVIPGINDNRGGRPSAIAVDAPFDTIEISAADGQVVERRRTVSEAIVDLVGQGDYLETAAALTGQPVDTVRHWLRTGAQVALLLAGNPDQQLTQHETNCYAFRQSFARARAQNEHDRLAELDVIARGGRRVTTTKVKREFANADDRQGVVTEATTETRELPPDPRTLIWRLAMANPGRFSPTLKLNIDPDVDLTDEDIDAGLAESFAAYLTARADLAEEQAAEAAADPTLTIGREIV